MTDWQPAERNICLPCCLPQAARTRKSSALPRCLTGCLGMAFKRMLCILTSLQASSASNYGFLYQRLYRGKTKANQSKPKYQNNPKPSENSWTLPGPN